MRESLLVIDKQPGPTSFDIVRSVKRLVGDAKVGHAGSLDPFASGVLVVMVGKATKLSHMLLNADKRYWAEVKLGQATDSMDVTGRTTDELAVPSLSPDDVAEALKSFEGIWKQTPPMFSAKKIKGVRFYELARQSIKVRRAPSPVSLYEMKFLSYEAPLIRFEVLCSKGTYVRALADEIGRKLGTCAHLHGLKRLACGEFTIDESVSLERLMADTATWLDRGYQNYVRLLRSEALRRPVTPVRTAPVGHAMSYRVNQTPGNVAGDEPAGCGPAGHNRKGLDREVGLPEGPE